MPGWAPGVSWAGGSTHPTSPGADQQVPWPRLFPGPHHTSRTTWGPLVALREDESPTWGRHGGRLPDSWCPGSPASVRGCGYGCHASPGSFLKKWATGSRGAQASAVQVLSSPKSHLVGTKAGLWMRPRGEGWDREEGPAGCGEGLLG